MQINKENVKIATESKLNIIKWHQRDSNPQPLSL